MHDPLFSSALFLGDGETPLLLVANDIIFVSRETSCRVRDRIHQQTGIPVANMMITATHTHSGPMTADQLCCEADPVVPKTDLQYVAQLEDGMVQAAVQAFHNAQPAELGQGIADGSCVGGNRHDPAGPANPEVPVLVVRNRDSRKFLAAMLVCSMHPTVLHEDSTLVSGDFPAMARRYLQEIVLGRDCPVLHHTGASGNQSPRHVAKANTFDEAERLGQLLGRSVARVIDSLSYADRIDLACARTFVHLPARSFPEVREARQHVERAAARLAILRQSGVNSGAVRTAECDWFGAEETLALARFAEAGRLQEVAVSLMPAEIIVMRIGDRTFAGWPGEVFVEFALQMRQQHRDCHVISLANGELQGYLANDVAVRQQWYEAMNSLFESPQSGAMLVEKTLELMGR